MDLLTGKPPGVDLSTEAPGFPRELEEQLQEDHHLV